MQSGENEVELVDTKLYKCAIVTVAYSSSELVFYYKTVNSEH